MAMKRISLVILLTLAFTTTSFAQKNTFYKDDKIVNFGLGIGNAIYESGYTNKIPPISASFEIGIIDNLFDSKSSIGVGGYAGFTGAKYEWHSNGYKYGYKYKSYIFGPRGYFHYQLVDNLDTYAGVMVGYNIVTSKKYGNFQGDPDALESSVAWSSFIGARYYFSNNLSAMAELGYGVAYLNIGIAMKF